MRSASVPAHPEIPGSLKFWNHRDLALLTGRSGIYGIAHIWLARLALGGSSVHVIDCAVRADAHTLTEEAVRTGVAPELLLSAITVQRAFTPYQILDVLRAELRREDAQERVVFIMAPCKQFFDGDVAEDECIFLLKKMLLVFRQFQRTGRPLMIVESEAYHSPHFAGVYAALKRQTEILFEYRGPEPGRPFALAVRHRNGGYQIIRDEQPRPTLPQRGIRSGDNEDGSNHYALFHSNANGGGPPERLPARAQAG